jgi:hypothetical protein
MVTNQIMRMEDNFRYQGEVVACELAKLEPALALYRPFGFAPVYDYWYRSLASERG